MATLTGTNGNDLLNGPNGETNVINGLGGQDTILGGLLSDTVTAFGADDSIDTGQGDDLIRIDDANDLVTGTILAGAGVDTLRATQSGQTFAIGRTFSFTGVERIDLRDGTLEVIAGERVDLTGLTLLNTTIRLAGAANLTGTAFADTVFGSAGDDVVRGGAGGDTIAGLDGVDFILGGGGGDLVNGGDDNDSILGGGGNDTITGGRGFDRMDGGDGDDVFVLGKVDGPNDFVFGGDGFDTVLLKGDIVSDGNLVLVAELLDGRGFTITIGDFLGLRNLGAVIDVPTILGTAAADTFQPSPSTDTVTLFGGDDLVSAEGGNLSGDVLDGGAGFDELQNIGGVDLLLTTQANLIGFESIQGFGRGLRTPTGGFDFTGLQVLGVSRIAGTKVIDTIVGATGNDTIFGGAAADLLIGANGRDVLFGGLGADTFRYLDNGDSPALLGDRIGDFEAGVDTIDLAGVDAISGGGDNSFVFIGAQAFSGAFGELRLSPTGNPGEFLLEGNTGGDIRSDFEITVVVASGAITGADFVL